MPISISGERNDKRQAEESDWSTRRKGRGCNGRGERHRSSHPEVFVAEGAKVVIAGPTPREIGEIRGKTGSGRELHTYGCFGEADVQAMIDHAVDQFGRLDCLVNNAGRSSQYVAITDVDLKEFDAVIAVHLRAVLAGMKYGARVMAAQGAGSIITVSSVNGIRAGFGGHFIRLRNRPPFT